MNTAIPRTYLIKSHTMVYIWQKGLNEQQKIIQVILTHSDHINLKVINMFTIKYNELRTLTPV